MNRGEMLIIKLILSAAFFLISVGIIKAAKEINIEQIPAAIILLAIVVIFK